MIKPLDTKFVEEKYEIADEATNASLFTTGNGYIGVRGSFEEYGSIRIQGAYIRGVIDEIIEVMEPFADNEYMKKYYIDEDKLREFEYQDSVINNVDFLLTRVCIDGECFYPWEGRIISWERYVNMLDATLVRKVRWESSKGDVTDIVFKRFASFDNDHIYCLKTEITPINHCKRICMISGVDTRVKTCGQKITSVLEKNVWDNNVFVRTSMGKKYGFETSVTATINLYGAKAQWRSAKEQGIVALETEIDSECGKTYTLEKAIYITSSREESTKVPNILNNTYDDYYKRHLAEYKKYYDIMNIKISGDNLADAGVRFANYHSLISASRNDSIHSISAKGLTGERYNNFVWWDCEVYQLPIFIYTAPDIAKKALIYRYNHLQQAKKNAINNGFSGAKYAFCSSVNGDEKVWIYARHPFMQIHINADIAWGIIHYVTATGDMEFLKEYGIKVLVELCDYWKSRVEKIDGKYEIRGVTGTDEHHPYVNNDAYTNYLVKLVLEKTSIYCKMLDICADYSEIADNLYLPLEKNGLIPQFDGYFDLSRTLEEVSGKNATSFQMKKSAAYHKSQVIKQPDVMLIYSYINEKPENADYAANWDYYEHMCESSSSLSFAPHSICSADNGRVLSAYNYLIDSAYIDVYDIHNCAWQGVHSGCLAGAWYAVFRGIAGIICREECLEINPHPIPWWDVLEFSFLYRGSKLNIKIDANSFILSSEADAEIQVFYRNVKYMISKERPLCEKI